MSTSSDWAYLSEGGANIVFRYVGPPHADFSSHVLRLRKTASSSSSGSSDADVEAELQFRELVIRPLLGEAHLPDCQLLALDRTLLEGLAELAEPHRPAARRAKGGLAVDATEGMLVADLIGRDEAAQGDQLAVEIKPKWGFLPSPTHLSSSTRALKTTYCRTCMHRQLKRDAAHIASTSGSPPSAGTYCPLDLYSGYEPRMRRAINELWLGWCEDLEGKSNSLRLFLNGKVVRSGDISRLARALSTADDSDIPAALADRLLPALKRSAVLQRLASLQSSLDHLDIEGLLATSGADESMRVNLEDYVRFAQSYPINLNPHTLDCSAKDRLVAFLLAATFKDCSIIARLALSTPVALTDGASPSSTVSCDQVKVIDLDPKPADRLPKWAKLDRDIVSHFAEHLERVGSEHVRKCCDG